MTDPALDKPLQSEAESLAEQSIEDRLDEYENALKFYARHEHWMSIAEDGLRREFVAMAGDGEQHGWLIAEKILAKHGAS